MLFPSCCILVIFLNSLLYSLRRFKGNFNVNKIISSCYLVQPGVLDALVYVFIFYTFSIFHTFYHFFYTFPIIHAFLVICMFFVIYTILFDSGDDIP